MSSKFIYTAKDRTPYTYHLCWSYVGLHYYGKRTAKGCHPSELGVTYFSSSKYVKELIMFYGDPDVIEVRYVFDNIENANKCESRTLRYVNAAKSENWLNITNGDNQWDTTGVASAKCARTGMSLGLVSLEDKRWETGSIVGMCKGKHLTKPLGFGEKVAKRMKGKPKTKESIEKRLITARNNIVDGLNSYQRAYIRNNEYKKSKIMDDGRTFNDHIIDKIRVSKKTNTDENGMNSDQRGYHNRIKNMRNTFNEFGISKFEESIEKRKRTMQDTINDKGENLSKVSAIKASKTMSMISDNGKTGHENRIEKGKITKHKNSQKYNVLDQDDNIVSSNLTAREVYKISPSLILKTKENYLAKAKFIATKFTNLGLSHLIGLYVIKVV